MFLFAILILMLVGDGLWWWRARRHFATSKTLTRRAVDVFAIVLIAALLMLLVGRAIGLRSEGLMPRAFLAFVFVWHLAGLPIAFLVGTGRSGASLLVERRRRQVVAPTPDAPPITRRAFLGRTTVAVPVVASLGGAAVAMRQLNTFRVRRIEVPIRGLPSGIDGLTIAHVSDTHLGTFTTADTFKRIVAATNDLDADLVCFTGDLINFDQNDLPVATSLVREMRARYGVHLCEGNHDLIQGREPFHQFMREARMSLLVDEAKVVRVNGVDVELMGLPWTRVPRGSSPDASIAAALAPLVGRRQAGAFPILMAHHPHAFDAAVAHQIPLTLSGHTHGGQIALSRTFGFGPLMYRYWSGLYERDGNACIVSNGVGNWFPVRVNVPAEILHLTLRNA